MHGTHVNFMAESGVGAVLELALVLRGVAYAEASQRGGEVPLGGAIIQTETPAAAGTEKRRCDTE